MPFKPISVERIVDFDGVSTFRLSCKEGFIRDTIRFFVDGEEVLEVKAGDGIGAKYHSGSRQFLLRGLEFSLAWEWDGGGNPKRITVSRYPDGALLLAYPVNDSDLISSLTGHSIDQIEFVDGATLEILGEEVIDVDKGARLEIDRARTLSRRIEIERWQTEGEMSQVVNEALMELIGTEVRAKLASQIGEHLGETEQISNKVTLDGNDAQQFHLRWVAAWRKGYVRTTAHSRPLHFRVCESLTLHVVTKQ